MNERIDVERQLAVLAEHAVAQSRAVRPSLADARPRRGLPLIRAGVVAAAIAAAAAVTVFIANRERDEGPRIDTAGTETTLPATVAPEYAANITVLESPDHGPQLCGFVLTSLPPQCSGPDVVGWDWADIDGEESAGGTTWGAFYVVGTWDGASLSLTEPPTAPVPVPHVPDVDFTTPCEELRSVDADAVVGIDAGIPGVATGASDYAGGWWDSTYGVLNVAFTGEVDRHRAEVSEVYSGRLCVLEFEHTEGELAAAQSRLSDPPAGVWLIATGQNVVDNEVSVDVMVADATTESWVRERVGDVAFTVRALLQPVAVTSTETTAPVTTTPPGRYPSSEIDNAAEAIDTWTAAGIGDYTFEYRRECFCPGIDTIVTIRDGVVVDAGAPEVDAPTIPELIADLERAEREATGAVVVEYGEYGVPVSASIDWLVNAVDDEISWTVTNLQLI